MTDNPLQRPPLSDADAAATPTERLARTRLRMQQLLQQPPDGLPLTAWAQTALQPLANRHPVWLVLAAVAVGALLVQRNHKRP